MSTKAKLIVAGVVGFILFLTLNGSEHAHKAFDPVGYWTEKRDKLQEMVEFYRNEVRSCRLEFEKLKRTRDITMRQAILSGSTRQEAREEFLSEWEATKEVCSTMRKLLSMEEANLQHANQELAKHE